MGTKCSVKGVIKLLDVKTSSKGTKYLVGTVEVSGGKYPERIELVAFSDVGKDLSELGVGDEVEVGGYATKIKVTEFRLTSGNAGTDDAMADAVNEVKGTFPGARVVSQVNAGDDDIPF